MNVFQYGAIAEKNWESNLSDMSGYERKYTFYSDFSIAEFCEVFMGDTNAVKKTYNNVIKSWGSSIEAMSEIVLVLNHKSWSFYGNVDNKFMGCSDAWRDKFMELYTELYEKCVDFIYKKFGEDEKAMEYYYNVTD